MTQFEQMRKMLKVANNMKGNPMKMMRNLRRR